MSGKNVAPSVRQRLINLGRKTGDDFQLLLTRFVIERFLYRLGKSEYAARFVLKGAMLFVLWTGEMHRPTKDLDLLGLGARSADKLKEAFRNLCSDVVQDDGILFMTDTVEVQPIREEQVYGGQRVILAAKLGTARIDLQVDVGFGDAITPRAQSVVFPTILGMDPPLIRAYPRETVVAEKLEALVKLGLTNSRMKDLYDLLVLSNTFEFVGESFKKQLRRHSRDAARRFPLSRPLQ